MLERFRKFIQEKELFNERDKILLAVSGGVDSVVMCEFFKQAGYQFAIAHCNFQLRANESEEDESFVRELALRFHVPIFVEHFETAQYANSQKLSVQMAARELRYRWFEGLLQEEKFDCLATAHHKDDVVETFFMNAIRGAGISGLHGIREKQSFIVRPLLFASKEEILLYAKEKEIDYREDSSNLCDKYARNKIRHQVIPTLKEINPAAIQNVITTIEHLKEIEEVFTNLIHDIKKRIIRKDEFLIKILIKDLKELVPLNVYLFEILREFNFNSSTVKDIVECLNGESGKIFFSSTHQLLRDREFLIISPKPEENLNAAFYIQANETSIQQPISLKIELLVKKQTSISHSKNIACLDYEKLKFPIKLRKWKMGDLFQPFGMKGKKKLSDFFIDQKLSLIEKENSWVLCSANDIVWIVGQRIDDRYKVTEETRQIYQIQYLLSC